MVGSETSPARERISFAISRDFRRREARRATLSVPDPRYGTELRKYVRQLIV